MFNKLIVTILISPMLMFSVGCFSEGGGVAFESSVDFLSSKIVVLGQGVANGSSYLYLEVHAINSNGTSIAGFVPELSATAGTGVVVHNCNATNSLGVARCAITSTVAGIKTLNLDNTNGALVAEDATFILPVLSTTIVSNVPGSTISNTTSGYKISASLSNIKAPLKYIDGSGHIVYSTVQGVVLSEEE